VTREQEIDEILKVQEQMRLDDLARVEAIALSQRVHYKAEVMAGKATMSHPSCKFCAARVADLLPIDLRACALNTERSNTARPTPLTDDVERGNEF
jgi:hypothetical protein